jgi:hypothetical protein
MRTRGLLILCLAALALGSAACFRPYGYHFYPDMSRFAPTYPGNVALLRGDPRREHVRLGEVWIRPGPMAGRAYVEGVLREKAAAMGADALVIVADRYFRERAFYGYWSPRRTVYDRQIVGIAIRYRR